MADTPTIGSYLTFEEVFGKTPSRSMLVDLVRDLSLDDCLQTVGKLSSLLSTRRVTPDELDMKAANDLGSARDRAHELISQGHRFVFPTRLSTLGRVALDVAQRRPADAFDNGAELDKFMRALLAITDVFDIGHRFASSNREVVEGEVARLMLRRLATRVDVPLASQLIRYWRLFVELPQRRPDLLVAGENFDERLTQKVGLTVRRYIMICFGLNVRSHDEETRTPAPLEQGRLREVVAPPLALAGGDRRVGVDRAAFVQ